MDRSLTRYCAVACIVAGGLFASGSGAVAFASPTDDGNGVDPTADGGSTATPQPTTAPRGCQPTDADTVSRLRHGRHDTRVGFGTDYTTPRVGFVAPPPMNLPAALAPAAGPDGGNVTPQGANSVTLPFVIDTATKPAGRQPARLPVVPDSVVPDSSEPDAVVGADSTANPQPEATTRREPPTIDLTPLVSQGVPTGPPITINNPLRELLPPDLDLQNPLVPQVLPAPLVAILTAAAPSTPMLGIGAPPADLAPMGMDIMQAPAPQQPPPTSSPGVEPLAPAPPPPASAMPENEPLAFRAGYSNYLRTASLAQIIAIAVPGAAAILLLSLGGGFIGYRQAKAGHVIRAEGITRFLR